MRKKRKLQGRAVEAAEVAADHAAPELQEALEAAALAAEPSGADDVEADAAADAEAEADGAEANAVDADAVDADALASDAAADLADSPPEPEAAVDPVDPLALDAERLETIIESLLFAGDRPLAVRDIKQLTGAKDTAAIEAALAALRARYDGRGIVLHDVAGGFQFRTASANSEWVQRLIAGRPVRLSRAQLETLAIIAYRQPITRPEIDEIRGVDSGSTLKLLMDRDLVRVLGKKEEPGRPLIYGTSREFLQFFHLKDLRELPTLREFHELSEDSLREVERLDSSDGGARRPASTATVVEASGDLSAEPAEAYAADHTVEPEVTVDAPQGEVDDGDATGDVAVSADDTAPGDGAPTTEDVAS